MIKLFGYVFLLSIWQSFLFYGKELGLSVFLFILPVCGLILYVFKKWNKIQRKYALLLFIPIILLSLTYFLYDGCLKWFNMIVIIGLFLMLFIMTSTSKENLLMFIQDSFSILIRPFSYFFNVLDIIFSSLFQNFKISDQVKGYIKSFFVVLPIILVILGLLSSADIIFRELLGGFFEYFSDFFIEVMKEDFGKRIFIIVVFFLYVSGMFYYFIVDYSDEQVMNGWLKEDFRIQKKDSIRIQLLFIILNIIYVIFDFIQIKSLMFHSVRSSIHYASYARQGFFQLMFVSIINLSLLLYSKRHYDKEKNIFLQVMSFMMLGLTLIIIVSSFLRMNLYESQYGYTLLRLLVYVTLITEIILLIPISLYILKDNYPIMKVGMMIIISIYIVINFIPIDRVIASRNIERYYDKDDLDLVYLENGRTDNLRELVSFYEEVENEEIRENLKIYFQELEISVDEIQEFNFSKIKGEKLIRKYK